MENSNDTSWLGTSDLPICSTALCYRDPPNKNSNNSNNNNQYNAFKFISVRNFSLCVPSSLLAASVQAL